MINAMDNKVLAPLILEAERKGREAGREEARQVARQDGMHELLLSLLTYKFGELPCWASERLRAARTEELRAWAKRALKELSLEETLG